MQNERNPLLLELCPVDALPNVVTDALAQLTLGERLALGTRLASVVGLRAEAILSGMDPLELDTLLDVDDVALLAAIVEPCLTSVLA